MVTTIARRPYHSTTIRRGRREPVSVDYHDAPQIPSAGFTLADLGSGSQITRLRRDGVDVHFASAPLWRLFIWDGIEDPLSVPATILPNTLGTAVVSQNAGGFTATWTHVALGTVAVTGVYADGGMKLRGTVTLGPAVVGTYTSWALELGRVAVKPFEVANKDLMTVGLPIVNGDIRRDATVVQASDVRMLHGQQYIADNGAVPHGTAAAQALYGSMQCMLVYQRGAETGQRAKAGLLIRTNDPGSRYKEFGFNGDGTNVIAYVREWNANNAAVGQGFTSDYDVELVPFRGGWFEGVSLFKARTAADALPAVAGGKLKDNPARVSSTIRDASLVIWVEPLDTDVSWAKATTEVQRIAAAWGVSPLVLVYAWHKELIGDKHPDWSPVRARAETFFAAMEALGAKTILYTNQHNWGAASSWLLNAGTPPTGYNAAYGNPATLVCTNPSGVPYVLDLAGGTTPPATTHAFPNLGEANVRNHILSTWPLVLNGGARWVWGFYDDASPNGLCQDYRAALAAANKGPGARFVPDGLRTKVTDERTACRALRAGFAIIAEFANDNFADVYEMAHLSSYDYAEGRALLPWFQTAFSEYFNLYAIDSFSTIPPSTAGTGLLRDFRWNQARHFHDGKRQTVLVNKDTTYLPWVGDPADSDYAFWVEHVKPLSDWVKTLVQSWDGARQLRKYFRGRRLRPLPGSYDEHLELNGATSDPIADPVEINFTEADVQSSVWQTDELAGAPVAVLLTNHGDAAASFEVVMSPERYPAMAGKGSLLKDGVAVQTIFGAFRYTVTIPALSLVVLELT